MLITIEQFRQWFEEDSTGLLNRLQEETGRYGSEEAESWQRSLQTLTKVFRAPSFQPLHLYFEKRGNLALEYQLPAASSWADVVLLGKHSNGGSAVILELKDWETAADRPGKAEGLVERMGRQELHPSDQVRGYTEYCRRFHSAIDATARVHGCVLFTRQPYTSAYTTKPNEKLTRDYPIFTTAPEDVAHRFPEFFQNRLTEPDAEFANKFATGRYRQERGFVAQIGAQILNPESKPFELLDNQRRAFALCKAVVDDCFLSNVRKSCAKRVIIVKGPPGSGKSAIAARLWASLVTDERLPEGDVVFTTTSLSQNSNWSYIFDQLAEEGGYALVRKASIVTPLTTHALGRLRRQYDNTFMSDPNDWRNNLKLLRDLGGGFHDGSRDDQNLITIVDEAHSLINPEHSAGRGQFGFVPTLGPQAYHIIRTSLLTIFLLDPLQGFRERENTTLEDIVNWSRELAASEPEVVSLDDVQFRCAGSAEYVSWVESVLNGASVDRNKLLAAAWRNSEPSSSPRAESPTKAKFRRSSFGFDFRLVDTPAELEQELRNHAAGGNSVRLLSSYSREWKTAKAAVPHELPPHMKDFCETYFENGQQKIWARVWNYVPQGGNDYTAFIRGAPGFPMAEDPLCEVGCPYAVRGFDYDCVGILWLNDLLWRNDRWIINIDAVHERGIINLVREARREKSQSGTATLELLSRTAQAYRIILTRALKGIYIWIADDETRDHIEACLGSTK
jgi:uncharacterized protein